MAGSPAWKVYDADKQYRAAFKYIGDAAILVAALGDGTTIRWDHSSRWTVWTEGKETQSAGESYDYVVEVARERLGKLQRDNLNRVRVRMDSWDRRGEK